MPVKPMFDRDAAYRKMLDLHQSIPPGPNRTERFLEMLHGPGWKARAIAAGPLILQYAKRIRELEERVARIEQRLKRSSDKPALPSRGQIEPLKLVREIPQE